MSQTAGASHTTSLNGAMTPAQSGNKTNVGHLSGIVVGVIMGVNLTTLTIFCIMHRRYRHERIEHNPLVYKDPELNLLPVSSVGVTGGDEEGEWSEEEVPWEKHEETPGSR
ncbi:hypothetical protein DL93DRAFT_2234744 [Clavulina sp. PMI_390]|nr:hypothetical protein DL93DRAFT_2234744 [Clavulina sp. PMI_390]